MVPPETALVMTGEFLCPPQRLFLHQSWERRGRIGAGMVPFEETLVSSYRLSTPSGTTALCDIDFLINWRYRNILTYLLTPISNLSSISTRFRDITAFVLQHTTFSHPTSSLLKVSPRSLGSRWMPFGWGLKTVVTKTVHLQDHPWNRRTQP